MHALEPEVPFQIRLQERRDHRPRGSVDMDRDVEPRRRLDLIELRGDLRDRLVGARVRDAHDRDDADRVLVDVLLELEPVEHRVLLADGDESHLDVPVVAELLPAHLDRRAHDEVRLLGRGALGAAPMLPEPLEGEPAEHARFAGSGRRRADRAFRGRHAPQVGEDPPAAVFDRRRGRVLVLVDHVLVVRLLVETIGVLVHPGRDERGEVQTGVPVEHRLVVDDLVGGLRKQLVRAEALMSRRAPANRSIEDRCQFGVHGLILADETITPQGVLREQSDRPVKRRTGRSRRAAQRRYPARTPSARHPRS